MLSILLILTVGYGHTQHIAIQSFPDRALSGIDNPLSIVVENQACKDITITPKYGEIIEHDQCVFIYNSRNVKLVKEVFYIKSKDGTIDDSVIYKLHPIIPVCSFANKFHGDSLSIQAMALLQAPLIPTMTDVDIHVYSLIRNHTIILIRNNEILVVARNEGNMIPKEVRDEIKEKALPGDHLLFCHLTCQVPMLGQVYLSPVELLLVE